MSNLNTLDSNDINNNLLLSLKKCKYILSEKHIKQNGKNILYKSDEKYLNNLFDKELPILNLSTDFSRHTSTSSQHDSIFFLLDKNLYKKLKMLNSITQFPIDIILYSAYCILLSKYSGQEDFVVGFELNKGNIIPARVSSKENILFLDFVYRNLENLAKISDLINSNSLPRACTLRSEAIFFRNSKFNSLIYPSQTKNYFNIQGNIISLNVEEYQNALIFSLNYDKKLFKKETIKIMSSHYTNILKSIINKPQKYISDVNLLLPEEKKIPQYIVPGHFKN